MTLILGMSLMGTLLADLYVVLFATALIAIIALSFVRNARKYKRAKTELFRCVADARSEAIERARCVDARNAVRPPDPPDDSDLFEFLPTPEPFRLKVGNEILYFKNLRSGQPKLAKAKILGFRWHRNKGQMVVLMNEFGGRLSRPIDDLMGTGK